MTEQPDTLMRIICTLNAHYKLGRNGREWQIWKKSPLTSRFELYQSRAGTRLGLLRWMKENAIYISKEAEEIINKEPETFENFAPDVEESA